MGDATAQRRVAFDDGKKVVVTAPGTPPATPLTAPSAEDAVASIEKQLRAAEEQVAYFHKHMDMATTAQAHVKAMSIALEKEIKALAKSDKHRAALEQRWRVLREVLPQTKSFFSRLLLGRVNLKVWSPAERLRLRDEYNKFKFRANVGFVSLPVIVLFAHYQLRLVWADTHWMSILHQLWLLYFYTSLALRENILLVNGSNVRAWWIYHHYIAAFGTVILITWPDSPTYVRFIPYWNLFLVYQGFVQMLQLWYQKKRDYANRALGRTAQLDVTFAETLTEFPRELLVLVPFLFGSFAWQMWIGVQLLSALVFEFDPLHTHWTLYREEVQVAITGTVIIVLSAGNIVNTTLALLAKRSRKDKGA